MRKARKMKHKLRATAKDSTLTVSCPACGAVAGEPCRDRNQVARTGYHLERFGELFQWETMRQTAMDFDQEGLGI